MFVSVQLCLTSLTLRHSHVLIHYEYNIRFILPPVTLSRFSGVNCVGNENESNFDFSGLG